MEMNGVVCSISLQSMFRNSTGSVENITQSTQSHAYTLNSNTFLLLSDSINLPEFVLSISHLHHRLKPHHTIPETQ